MAIDDVVLSIATAGGGATVPEFVITIDDDGRGFVPPSSSAEGKNLGQSGLVNMRRRVKDLGSRFTFQSSPSAGTQIPRVTVY